MNRRETAEERHQRVMAGLVEAIENRGRELQAQGIHIPGLEFAAQSG